jgi:hypothetical protein
MYLVTVLKPEEKRELGRPSYRWEDTTQMRLKEMMYAVTDCIHLAHTVEHVAGCCDPSNELSGFLTRLSSCLFLRDLSPSELVIILSFPLPTSNLDSGVFYGVN